MSVGGSGFRQLISLLRVPFSLGMFYTSSYIPMLFCVLGAFIFRSNGYLICGTSFWSILLCGAYRIQCPLLLDIVST